MKWSTSASEESELGSGHTA